MENPVKVCCDWKCSVLSSSPNNDKWHSGYVCVTHPKDGCWHMQLYLSANFNHELPRHNIKLSGEITKLLIQNERILVTIKSALYSCKFKNSREKEKIASILTDIQSRPCSLHSGMRCLSNVANGLNGLKSLEASTASQNTVSYARMTHSTPTKENMSMPSQWNSSNVKTPSHNFTRVKEHNVSPLDELVDNSSPLEKSYKNSGKDSETKKKFLDSSISKADKLILLPDFYGNRSSSSVFANSNGNSGHCDQDIDSGSLKRSIGVQSKCGPGDVMKLTADIKLQVEDTVVDLLECHQNFTETELRSKAAQMLPEMDQFAREVLVHGVVTAARHVAVISRQYEVYNSQSGGDEHSAEYAYALASWMWGFRRQRRDIGVNAGQVETVGGTLVPSQLDNANQCATSQIDGGEKRNTMVAIDLSTPLQAERRSNWSGDVVDISPVALDLRKAAKVQPTLGHPTSAASFQECWVTPRVVHACQPDIAVVTTTTKKEISAGETGQTRGAVQNGTAEAASQ